MQIDHHLQTIYNRTVGLDLKIKLRRKSSLVSTILPLLSIFSVFLTHYVVRRAEHTSRRSFVFQATPYCYLDTLTYMLGAYWYLACDGISSTALVLAEHFHKVIPWIET